MTWPDLLALALVTLGPLALMAFTFWLLLRNGD